MRKSVAPALGATLLAMAMLGAPASPAGAQDQAPPSPGPDAVQAGRSLYSRNCSHCHGFNMVNPGTVSYDLRKFPPEDPQRFFDSVKDGRGSMPAWKGSLSDEQIRLIWAYVLTGGKP